MTELPLDGNSPPPEFIAQLASGRGVCVVEEHVRRGGLGAELALFMLGKGIHPGAFQHLYARAHHYASYGSQNFLRAQSGLDVPSLLAALSKHDS